MYTLKNVSNIGVGLPAPSYGAVVIEPGHSVDVSDNHYAELTKSMYTRNTIDCGDVVVKYHKDKPKVKNSQRGVRLVSQKGGWWKVFVNGELITGTSVRKEEAERIAAEYK